jgi:RimJ/RimL family protein N-acetyltransferase
MQEKDGAKLYQLSLENFSLAQPLFAAEQHLAVLSALAGESPAELYVDDPQAPQAALLYLWNNRIYLAGNPGQTAFTEAFAALLHERCAPLVHGNEPIDRVIAFTPASWEPLLASLFADIESFRAERQYYRIHLNKPIPLPVLPEGFVLRKVNAALVAETTLTNHDSLLSEMQSEAPSVAYFLQHRFGFCLQHGQELVSWCLSEYNYDHQCESGIETLPAFQRRGLATATALATMAYAQSQGITMIGWHCWKRNIPSSALARKIGFELIEDYPVWYCRFGKRPA